MLFRSRIAIFGCLLFPYSHKPALCLHAGLTSCCLEWVKGRALALASGGPPSFLLTWGRASSPGPCTRGDTPSSRAGSVHGALQTALSSAAHPLQGVHPRGVTCPPGGRLGRRPVQELAGELGDFETGNSRVWGAGLWSRGERDRKSTRLNSSH